MASQQGFTQERAQQILFRFLSLQIFEYCPAPLLRGDAV
jgi:hypothetical protein